MLSRHYGAVARRTAATAAASARPVTEMTSRLPSGLTVSSVDLHGATSQLLIAYRSGTRYEPDNTPGITHVIRNNVGRDNERFYGLTLVWNSALQGANVSALITREIFAVRMGIYRDNVGIALPILGHLAVNAYKPWEVEEARETFEYDFCRRESARDELHRAAFRNGPLGKGVQAEKPSSISWQAIQRFAENHQLTEEAIVVGVNVDHDTLVNIAGSELPIKAGKSPIVSTASKYFGGDSRRQSGYPKTFVAVGGEGSSLADIKSVAAQAIAVEILLHVAQKVYPHARSVNYNYSDAGLVGVEFEAPNNSISSVSRSIFTAVKNAKADGEATKIGKAKALLKIMSAGESGAAVALDTATQILATGNNVSLAEFVEAVRNTSDNDVAKALSKASSKLSVGVHGSPQLVPYLDEL
ncbi:hypothetical protein WR25_04052 [Diploscapter pachys]|uniref:Peptidase M16 N-terminal domain-containing protein n=1 Tax=Diploscapter pachys TaxID=2018661 RepID=A0A2A2KLS7_9BILA|nr:hypothetical protein WR25_04052 [Diploscapter pachys]